jgi:hypothetical protein
MGLLEPTKTFNDPRSALKDYVKKKKAGVEKHHSTCF